MKRSMTWLGEAVIAAAIVAATVALALPAAPRVPPGAPAAGLAADPVPEPAAEPSFVRASASPPQIAALFGWKEPRPAGSPAVARTAPSKPAPVRLKVVGFVESDTGTVSWIFKDLQTGTVISLAPGATNRGWTLVEVREQEFRLAFQGTTHTIPRSK